MIKHEVVIEETRFIELCEREKEAELLFEEFCRVFTIQFFKLNTKEDWYENYNDSIAEFVNLQINSLNLKFNGTTPSVWFNSIGHGSMLYWGYKDSKSVPRIDNIIDRHKNS